MFESKYSKVLTAILVIVIIAIIGLLGFLAYDYFQGVQTQQSASDFVDNYERSDSGDATADENVASDENIFSNIEDISSTGTGSSVKTYKGFVVMGTMSIPAINFKYPVLEKVTKKSIETAVAILYNSQGLNQPGNTVIIGHNYRNGLFFSNNKNLKVGDKIYITDNSGTQLTYNIYNKFETTASDTSFYQRDTGGVAEVTLSTCTDAGGDSRLIIEARAE